MIVSEFYAFAGMMSDPKDEMDWALGTFNEEMKNMRTRCRMAPISPCLNGSPGSMIFKADKADELAAQGKELKNHDQL